jgi:hypothetical protein
MALCEDESSGLARVASDDRIVRHFVARRQDLTAVREGGAGSRNSGSQTVLTTWLPGDGVAVNASTNRIYVANTGSSLCVIGRGSI